MHYQDFCVVCSRIRREHSVELTSKGVVTYNRLSEKTIVYFMISA